MEMSTKLPENVRLIYEREDVAKFLATQSADGVPNVALIVSQVPLDEERIAFGEFMMVKTKKNLLENPKFSSLCVSPKLELGGFKGEVLEWTEKGEAIDRINNIEFFRYNAYTGVGMAAVSSIKEILSFPPRMSYAKVLRDYLLASTISFYGGKERGGVSLPQVVKEKIDSVFSIKVVAYAGADGFPEIMPVFGIRVKGNSEVRFVPGDSKKAIIPCDLPANIALNVLTQDLLSYQVKGEVVRIDRTLNITSEVIKVREVYSSMPPFCGERIA